MERLAMIVILALTVALIVYSAAKSASTKINSVTSSAVVAGQ